MMLYKALFVATFLLCCNILVLCEIPRPRGLSISKSALYSPADHFTCLDGLKTIRYTQINDDFCDCADASDEPGTSACPNGKFHCANAGFKTLNIPSSRVNDGICDCCDGSDEYDLKAKCVDHCFQLGKEERQKEKVFQELLKKGTVLRNELSEKGNILKAEREARLAELEKRKSEAEAIMQEKEQIKKEAEGYKNEALQLYSDIQEAEKASQHEEEASENRKEAEQTFLKFDSNSDNFIELAELQTRISFDKDRNGEVSIEEAKFFLDEQDRVDMETFVSTCWPRIKPYLMVDAGLFKPPSPIETAVPDLENEDSYNLEEHESNEAERYDDDEEETGNGDVEEVQQRDQEYDPETQKIIENANKATNEFSEAERIVREIEHEIREIKEATGRDYGALEEFAPLDGECYSYDDREYVYKLCPFDRASQQPRNGGGETRLGSWDKWTGLDNIYSSMLFNNGATCWNGPQRSASVKLECGLEHKLTSVSEPNRCEYQFVFQTPAACDEAVKKSNLHDEL